MSIRGNSIQRIDNVVGRHATSISAAKLVGLNGVIDHIRQHQIASRKLKVGETSLSPLLLIGGTAQARIAAAAIVAEQLELDLYRIDLASLISRYIDETEKNLARIFETGARTKSVLVFDEADVIFGKRSPVKDAHDRHVLAEYLLRTIKRYSGVVILAMDAVDDCDPTLKSTGLIVLDLEPDMSKSPPT